MVSLVDLYNLADSENIKVDCFDLHRNESLSLMDNEGNQYIAINPFSLTSEKDERIKLAHEIGHCMTGSFYNIYSPLDNRRKKELIADRWVIKKLVPKDELDKAILKGYRETWELAEYFDVPEKLIEKAIEYYKLVG